MLKKPFEHLQIVPGGLSQLILLRNVSQKLLSPWEKLIYEKILSLDLLGPWDNFFYQKQKNCQTNLVLPQKLFPVLCLVRENEKK